MVTPIELLFRTEPLSEGNTQNVFIVQFKGELDESNIDNTAKEIYKLLEELAPATPVIFDFTELRYMNSKSIGYLSDWYTRLGEKESELVIAHPQENILDILQTVGLDNFIRLVPTLDDAKKIFLNGPDAPAEDTAVVTVEKPTAVTEEAA